MKNIGIVTPQRGAQFEIEIEVPKKTANDKWHELDKPDFHHQFIREHGNIHRLSQVSRKFTAEFGNASGRMQ